MIQCLKLKDDFEKISKIKYDYVIVTRPDIYFLDNHNFLNLDNIKNLDKSDCIIFT